jgi:LPS export ABC transporter protein LptC
VIRQEVAWWLVMTLAFIGCRKSVPKVALTLPATGSVNQVLVDFQMQDIMNGAKNMVVQSVEGRVSDQQRVADVDKPNVTFYKKGKATSVLTAPQGRVLMDTHEVQVWGGVTVVTQDSSTLKTDRLRYDPQTQHLVSTDSVRLEKPDSITEGVGLDADPDLSRVRIGHEKVYLKSRHG